MQYEKAYSFLIDKLETGLPSYLTYHDSEHTKSVIAAAEHLAMGENINGDDLTLLKTAALFHDAGFLQNEQDHEEISCRLAQKYLPEFDYSPAQIETICRMILTTKLPQSATDPLSRLLCDADLYYLGGDDYTERAEKLYAEFKRNGVVKNKAQWDLKQAEFLGAHQYFSDTARKEREERKHKNKELLQSKISEAYLPIKTNKLFEYGQDFLSMFFGVLMAGFALKYFLVPNQFFDGGITGISLLLHETYHLNLAIVIVLLNLPLIAISMYSVGRRFALRTLLSVCMLGTCLWLLPSVALTADKLLIAIFGGVFLGIGIGLVMRAGAALDGIEVLALYTLKRTSFTIIEIILAINVLIFTIVAIKFDIDKALYSILTYFCVTRCIDYVVEGIQAYTGVTIISGKSEVIKFQLVNRLGRGITVYKGERGFLPGKYEVSSDCDIIFTVITRLELRKLKNLVYDVDPKAFVFASTIKEASGGVIKRRHSH